MQQHTSHKNEARPQVSPDAAMFSASLSGGIEYRELRSLVSMSDVLRVLDWKPVERHGDQLRGPCMVHGSSSETSRSLSLNLKKNAYRCFAACCNSQGNQLDLYAAARKLSLFEAATELCDRLHVAPPRLRESDK